VIYVVDLDDTICFPNHEMLDTYSKYSLANPNVKLIEKLRQLKSDGHTIIIHSARTNVDPQGKSNSNRVGRWRCN